MLRRGVEITEKGKWSKQQQGNRKKKPGEKQEGTWTTVDKENKSTPL